MSALDLARGRHGQAVHELDQPGVFVRGGLAAHSVTPAHLPRLVAIATADICHQTNPHPCTAADFEALFKAAM